MAGKKKESGEDRIIEELTERLNELMKKDTYQPKIKIDSYVTVLKDVTAISNKNKTEWKLVFGSAEQDIVVYLDDEKYRIKIPFEKVESIERARGSFPPNSKIKTHFPYVIIPYVIWEVKYGNLITHQIALYSSYAQQIKDKFPDVMYNILTINPRRSYQALYRHGKNFDFILRYDEYDPEEISKKMYEVIRSHMKFHGILKS